MPDRPSEKETSQPESPPPETPDPDRAEELVRKMQAVNKQKEDLERRLREGRL